MKSSNRASAAFVSGKQISAKSLFRSRRAWLQFLCWRALCARPQSRLPCVYGTGHRGWRALCLLHTLVSHTLALFRGRWARQPNAGSSVSIGTSHVFFFSQGHFFVHVHATILVHLSPGGVPRPRLNSPFAPRKPHRPPKGEHSPLPPHNTHNLLNWYPAESK